MQVFCPADARRLMIDMFVAGSAWPHSQSGLENECPRGRFFFVLTDLMQGSSQL